MQIKDICRETGLTRKAVEYYEGKGLICPALGENGYRQYHASEIATLKEIALLRRLGIGVADIREITECQDKSAVLNKCLRKMEANMQEMNARHDTLRFLMDSGYDITQAAAYADKALDGYTAIKEKLLDAFPGGYGLYLYIHFGSFLDGPIDSPEKEDAYRAILDFLDGVQSMEISPELERCLEQAFDAMTREDMEHIHGTLVGAVGDIEGYMEQNKDVLEDYLRYRKTDAYRDSAAGKMKKILTDFQRSAGYYDVFIPNLKILSPSYRAYMEKAEEANAVFLAQYPEGETLR